MRTIAPYENQAPFAAPQDKRIKTGGSGGDNRRPVRTGFIALEADFFKQLLQEA